ncbi:hypothetical protein BDN72DRAFT_906226 [Pluteus cervinus]|uniref:Uncharacterized protein n=1 Tax=Pluteus cervinus TaxID=181527 RepID=A0ACD3A075_9AGAR|nr:hypothetical protein BDN72DRAFT_906226 [Pluteus cervinus]
MSLPHEEDASEIYSYHTTRIAMLGSRLRAAARALQLRFPPTNGFPEAAPTSLEYPDYSSVRRDDVYRNMWFDRCEEEYKQLRIDIGTAAIYNHPPALPTFFRVLARFLAEKERQCAYAVPFTNYLWFATTEDDPSSIVQTYVHDWWNYNCPEDVELPPEWYNQRVTLDNFISNHPNFTAPTPAPPGTEFLKEVIRARVTLTSITSYLEAQWQTLARDWVSDYTLSAAQENVSENITTILNDHIGPIRKRMAQVTSFPQHLTPEDMVWGARRRRLLNMPVGDFDPKLGYVGGPSQHFPHEKVVSAINSVIRGNPNAPKTTLRPAVNTLSKQSTSGNPEVIDISDSEEGELDTKAKPPISITSTTSRNPGRFANILTPPRIPINIIDVDRAADASVNLASPYRRVHSNPIHVTTPVEIPSSFNPRPESPLSSTSSVESLDGVLDNVEPEDDITSVLETIPSPIGPRPPSPSLDSDSV